MPENLDQLYVELATLQTIQSLLTSRTNRLVDQLTATYYEREISKTPPALDYGILRQHYSVNLELANDIASQLEQVKQKIEQQWRVTPPDLAEILDPYTIPSNPRVAWVVEGGGNRPTTKDDLIDILLEELKAGA